MFLQLSLFSLLAFVAADPVPMADGTNLSGEKLQGAHDVDIEQVPHQVSVQALQKHHCGGAIISPTWVLTAAKCVEYSSHQLSVRAGSTRYSSGGSVHQVDRAIQHPNYYINEDNVPVNDVALLKVRTPIDLHGTPKAIKVSRDKVPTGASATVTGWGSADINGTQWETLRRIYQNTIANHKCDESYKELVRLPEEKICVDVPGGKGACEGDEGGPVSVDNQLVGLVSWHYGCGQKGYPDVHTEIYPVRSWIVSITGIE